MAQNTAFGGIDCGKSALDLSVFPGLQRLHVANTPAGHVEAIAWLAAQGVSCVGMEASGGCERPVRDALMAANMKVHVFEPARVRHFAKAKGKRAKTDTLDAAVIAEFTAQAADVPGTVVDRDREDLAKLVRMRRLLVDKRADVARALSGLPKEAEALVSPVLDALRVAVAGLEVAIDRHIQAHDAMAQTVKRLQSAPGVGSTTAAVLVALVPELGQISGAQAAALLGVAPYPDDSGQRHGRRHVVGGRAQARCALYMAALVGAASPHKHGVLAAFYERLIAKGKPPKVALVACMRKMIVRLNAMLAHHQDWSEQPA